MKNLSKMLSAFFEKIDPDTSLVSESVRTDFINALEEHTDRSVAAKVSEIRKNLSESKQADENTVDAETAASMVKEAVLAERTRVLDISKKRILAERKLIADNANKKIAKIKKLASSTVVESAPRKTNISKIEKNIVEKVSMFLDEHVNNIRPAGEIISEHEIAELKRFRAAVKELAVVSEMEIKKEIKESFEDGLNEINKLKAKVNNLVVEKAKVCRKLNKVTSEKMLSEKLNGLTPKKRLYLENQFKNATLTEIEEKFDEAKLAYEQDEKIKRNVISERVAKKFTKAAPNKRVLPENVNPKRNRKKTVVESVEPTTKPANNMMDHYTSVLNYDQA